MVTCANCGEENPPKFRLCGYCGAGLAGALPSLPAREMRKTVTLIFSDVEDSSALSDRLDAEVINEIKDRYFAAMSAEIAHHGGRVEKCIGFTIVAVFGVPRVHEDDALRAVRAAYGMRGALARLNQDLQTRCGVALASRFAVNTGEVVASDDLDAAQKLIDFDAAKVAERLALCASPNCIHIGEATHRLVREAVEVEAVASIQPDDSDAMPVAYRLLSVRGLEPYSRRHDTPIVGRDDELAGLNQAYRRACRQQAARLITVIGDAGVGKSRLVHEFAGRVGVAARVLHGRCLPYGDGTGFHPLMGMASEAAGILSDDHPEAARAKLLALVGNVDVADRLASAVGLSSAVFPLPELNWSARKFLEGLAATGPVVVWVDDIHWAEPPLLEMLRHILEHAANASILLLATARHELLDAQPQWGVGAGAERLMLRPLIDAEAARVVANLIGPAGLPQDATDRILAAAAGNPLYVEQMLAMLIDSGALRHEEGCWVRSSSYGAIDVPPTIKALLEARLDLLARADRVTLDTASVIGGDFGRDALQALVPVAVRVNIDVHLGTLARRQFVQTPDRALAEGLYRFQHHLLRETAYNSLLKRTRIDLHLEFVRWADRVNADSELGISHEEILGWHLEQAWRYLGELGPLGAAGVEIGIDAGRRLSAAGRRAAARGDMHAAATLLRRAIALLPADDAQRLPLLPELGDVLRALGEFSEARTVLADAVTAAQATSDERIELSASLIGAFVRLFSGEEGEWAAKALRQAEAAIPKLERLGAHFELAIAWRLIAFVHGVAGQFSRADAANMHFMASARRAGNDRLVARSAMGFAAGALAGPTPVLEAIAGCERSIAEGLNDRQVQSVIQCMLAQLCAMNGQFDEARRLYREGRAMLRELGQGLTAASTSIDVARVEMLAGDLVAAESEVRADYDFLKKSGETYFLASLEGLMARIVRDQGRDAEALVMTQAVEAAAAEDDIEAQVQWRGVRAPILARAGNLAAAEAMAHEAVDMARRSEAPVLLADTLCELADVLALAGRSAEARVATGEATALYRAKGDWVSAERSGARAFAAPSA